MAGHAGSWRVRPIPAVLVVLVAVAGLAGCTGGADRDRVKASISVSPRAALVDEPVAVTVQGLPAGARTTLSATAGDADGSTWSATAQFTATSAGTVSLDQPSLGGSYTGVNPMGLFTFDGSAAGLGPRLVPLPRGQLRRRLAGQRRRPRGRHGQRPPAGPVCGRRGREAAASQQQRRDLRQPLPAQAHRGQASGGAGLRRRRRRPDHEHGGGPGGGPWLSEPDPGLLQGARPAPGPA